MNFKEIKEMLINYRWDFTDVMYLVLCIVLGCAITTPFIGVPIGIIAFFYLFFDGDDD
ncbi:VraH family peptide resistance protein [Staphylococcus gallinarum]|uniref:VraH family peptide resistance protein n=1 Tax=Staphylococcus gallinarum TaxID=1293 RepID=UPI0030C3D1BC